MNFKFWPFKMDFNYLPLPKQEKKHAYVGTYGAEAGTHHKYQGFAIQPMPRASVEKKVAGCSYNI